MNVASLYNYTSFSYSSSSMTMRMPALTRFHFQCRQQGPWRKRRPVGGLVAPDTDRDPELPHSKGGLLSPSVEEVCIRWFGLWGRCRDLAQPHQPLEPAAALAVVASVPH